jgi:hypothetical protein
MSQDTNNSDAQLKAGTPPAMPIATDAFVIPNTDADALRNRGITGSGVGDGNQNTLSYCRGPEAIADRSTAPATKEVDSRVITGSHRVGDHRSSNGKAADASLNQAATGHGAFDTMGQQRMGQFPNGKNDRA